MISKNIPFVDSSTIGATITAPARLFSVPASESLAN
jgi:hypothetical protein